jgi:uncharacterized protein YutE (UPF0331/DUF86 family)
MQHKLIYGGVILAAVAFETGLRDLAKRCDLDMKLPTSRIIRELSKRVGSKPFIEQMETLARLRNVVVHGQIDKDSFDAEDADEVFSAFEDGFNNMQEMAYRYYM